MPPCNPQELSLDCFSDGLVEFMLSRLQSSSPSNFPDSITPNWTRKVFTSMYEVLEPLKPDAILIASTGYHQDKTISTLCSNLPSHPIIAFDLPNPYPVLGLTADFFISPSVAVSTINGSPEAAATAQPSGAEVYVLPPSVDPVFFNLSKEASECPEFINNIKSQLHLLNCDTDSGEENCVIYGMVSRLSPEKSIGFAIQSFAALVDKVSSSGSR